MARPFPLVLFALFESCWLASTVVRSPPLRYTTFILALSIAAYLPFTTTGDPVSDYFIGSVLFTHLFTIADYALITDVHRELRITGQTQHPIPESAPFVQRLKWGVRLCLATRGVRWEHEPREVLRARMASPGTTRWRFVLRQMMMLGYYLLLQDIASIYNRASPVHHAGGPPLDSRPFPWRVVDLFFFAVINFGGQNLLHTVYSIISVGLGFSDPQDWVNVFGYRGDAYTLRRFWGRTWHQFLRRWVLTHGKFLARTLGLRKGTNASAYTQLYTAFLLSALLHVLSDYMVHRSLAPWASGSLRFFLLQPLAITVEDFVLFVGRKMGLGREGKRDIRLLGGWISMVRVLGYVWVTGWFVCTYSRWWSPMIRGGMVEKTLNLKWSVVLGVWKGEWRQGR
ncbi:membrane bound O-acyl transferase family-domain-containing protein [Favolaschia claudopus]|uniref:Membrane bound O-acyl transferase family-domain-containing protein n=1 Tax=Favolaschia claudopus TaxID=2862362 RepID=A0AAW0AXI8_9AGAR